MLVEHESLAQKLVERGNEHEKIRRVVGVDDVESVPHGNPRRQDHCRSERVRVLQDVSHEP
jgi:hypothetical protein